jgi:hypothetical protein
MVRTAALLLLLSLGCDPLDQGSYEGEILLGVAFNFDEIASLLSPTGDTAYLVWEDGQRSLLGYPSIEFDGAGGHLYEFPVSTADVMVGRFQVLGSIEVLGQRLTSRSYVEFRAPNELRLWVDHPDATVRACHDNADFALASCKNDEACAVAQQQLDACADPLIEAPPWNELEPAPIVYLWPAPFNSLDDLTRRQSR